MYLKATSKPPPPKPLQGKEAVRVPQEALLNFGQRTEALSGLCPGLTPGKLPDFSELHVLTRSSPSPFIL